MLSEFNAEAASRVNAEIERLRKLSRAEARALSEMDESDMTIDGHKASLAIFRYDSPFEELAGKTLVVVLVTTPMLWGMGAWHVERGLVFSEGQPPREATQAELENSGG